MAETLTVGPDNLVHGDGAELDQVIIHNEKVMESLPPDNETANTARVILDVAYAEKHGVDGEATVDEWRSEESSDVEQLLESGGQHELTSGIDNSDPSGAKDMLRRIGWYKPADPASVERKIQEGFDAYLDPDGSRRRDQAEAREGSHEEGESNV